MQEEKEIFDVTIDAEEEIELTESDLELKAKLLAEAESDKEEIIEQKTNKNPANHYVDRTKLFNAFVEWDKAKQINPEAKMPNFIAEASVLIANHLIHRNNFNRYTWREAMISEAIYHCYKYAHNFDCKKYPTENYAFSYLNRICVHAFIQVIVREKKYQTSKMEYAINSRIDTYVEGADNRGLVDMDNVKNMYHHRKKLDEIV